MTTTKATLPPIHATTWIRIVGSRGLDYGARVGTTLFPVMTALPFIGPVDVPVDGVPAPLGPLWMPDPSRMSPTTKARLAALIAERTSSPLDEVVKAMESFEIPIRHGPEVEIVMRLSVECGRREWN